MKRNIIKLTLIFILVVSSIFAGYENPKLVEIPKKYFRFLGKKIGFQDTFLDQKIEDIGTQAITEKEQIKHEGNSFSVFLSKVLSYSGNSASVFISEDDNKIKHRVFIQEGFEIKENNTSEMNLPFSFYTEKSGGVKSVFLVKNKYFALVSLKKFSCLYASIIRLEDSKEIISSDCLPDSNLADFSGLGGAYIKTDNEVLLTIGAPEHKSEKISKLAQSKNSIFGKVLLLKKKDLLNYENEEKIIYHIFSLGHRNPQGLVLHDNKIFSLEHGPQGGDELNEIIEGKNYGWPIVSYGTRYNNGKSFRGAHSSLKFKEPLFSFLPAIAPSALNICPKNLLNYYKNNNCLMGLSLKEMSIIIFLLNKENTRVVSIEKIRLKKRLRHFGLESSGDLFVDNENYFYISADGDGLYKVKFDEFR